MSNEEFERKMEFIVEQQAQFAANIQVMQEVHDADVKLLKEETKLQKEEMKLVKEQHRNLSDAVTAVVGMMGRLAAAQERTDAKVAEMSDRLNVFIGVVERYIGGNGTKRSPDHS